MRSSVSNAGGCNKGAHNRMPNCSLQVAAPAPRQVPALTLVPPQGGGDREAEKGGRPKADPAPVLPPLGPFEIPPAQAGGGRRAWEVHVRVGG